MKKALMMVVIGFFVLVGFTSCAEDKGTITGGSGLPEGWSAAWESNEPLLADWHVGQTYRYTLKIYDQNNVEVTDYDTSSTKWWVEQTGTIVTLSDATGSITYITAQSAGSFILHCDFKGSHPYQTIHIVP